MGSAIGAAMAVAAVAVAGAAAAVAVAGAAAAALVEEAAMASKRRTEVAPRLDEADRTLYSSFCGAANSLSQLYSQAMAQQKQSFHAGELHALEKLSQWILKKHEEESRLTVADIMAHIQHEMDITASYGQASGLAPRASNSERSKNATMFSNALSSPVRRSLQNYHPTQGGAGNGGRNTEANSAGQNRESSNDTTMDTVSDSAANEYC